MSYKMDNSPMLDKSSRLGIMEVKWFLRIDGELVCLQSAIKFTSYNFLYQGKENEISISIVFVINEKIVIVIKCHCHEKLV